MPKTMIEPFRIKSVEPIRMTTRDERVQLLEDAKLNVFKLRAEDVILDFLTDSGTGAMSSRQWAAIMLGDESYAGARSFFRLQEVIQKLTGYEHIIPTHQGRASERIFFGVATKQGDIVPNNTHFDTTRANLEFDGAEAVDLVIPEGTQPATLHPFKGNIDLGKVEDLLKREGAPDPVRHDHPHQQLRRRPAGVHGQPAGLQRTAEEVRQAPDPGRLPVRRERHVHQAARAGHAGPHPRAIAHEMFRLRDGCLMSAKKDGMVNIGGFIVLQRRTGWMPPQHADPHRRLPHLRRPGRTRPGGAGVGLEEVLHEDYLRYRLRTAEYMGEKLLAGGVSIVQPTGGHAVYIDAKAFLPHLMPQDYPAWSLANALYLEGGIRGVEIGSVMFGKRLEDGTETYSNMELVRMAFPRRVYTQSHFDFAAEVICEVKAKAEQVRGVRIAKQSKYLRHFGAEMVWA